MEGRISATGLKSVEIDELTTNQIIINNEGLQYYHNYNILLPTVTEGYYNLQEELDNIMISNTTQDLELFQLQSGLSTAQANITTLGAGLLLTSAGTLLALDLVNQKSWILFFQKPLRSDISSNVYLDFDTNYFTIDASNNLTLNNLWKKDVSNNLYFTSGKVGIGITNPGANYNLDVLGNINCSEIYRNGTPISSTLSLFLPLTGGTLTGVLTGTTISATNMTASLFSGSGASLTNLNASNIITGTLSVNGSGLTNINASNIITGTLSVNGSGLTNLNAANITTGTLSITRGGIGTTTLSSNQILIGNAATSILQSSSLSWNNTSNTLSASNLQMSGQITGVTTLNGTTGIFGKLQTTNNSDVAVPSLGIAGGTGDKLILYAGTASIYPYSIGINTNTLWYSVPSGASHKFYNNGTNTLTIDSTTLTTTKHIQMGSVNGYNLGVATTAGEFSTSANAGDMVLRSTNRLLLQSGTGGYGIMVDTDGTTTCAGNLKVTGLANIHNGSPYAVANGKMHSGSFTIGGTDANYGTATNWSSSTAGFLMECSDYTEMCVHSTGQRISSFMYYDGPNNRFIIGRNKGSGIPYLTLNGTVVFKNDSWLLSGEYNNRFYFGNSGSSYYQGYGTNCHIFRTGTGVDIMTLKSSCDVRVEGEITCKLFTISGSYRDLMGVYAEGTTAGSFGYYALKVIEGTFTGFHRCFTEDEYFDKDEPQLFRDKYEGRIVISTGKIATDTNDNGTDWKIKYDKDGITIEDALPLIELSRNKKDKRVFGVLGASKRKCARKERIIINSVGEGALYVINSNGNIENGDYITSSDYLGYGEKQDEIFLCNYTVAKATMDCNFELDSNLYNCLELENGLRIAFIAVTYHCA